MSTESNDQYRAGFEAWAKQRGHNVVSRLETGGKFYVSSFTRHAWEIWLASKREASTEPSAKLSPVQVVELMTAHGIHYQPGIASFVKAVAACAAGALSDDAKDALIPCAYRVGQYKIEEVGQIEGPALWAVRLNGNCLNKSGAFEWEPMPSGRDDDFLARCRFDSARAASACLLAAIEAHKTGEKKP